MTITATEKTKLLAALNVILRDVIERNLTESEAETALYNEETGILELDIFSWQEADGTALAVFADGASAVPGYNLANSEALGIRWNNHANPDPIGRGFIVPPDLDETVAATLHFIASKVGATEADAVTWTSQLFMNSVGALHDADADFGGASGAMTGDAATKTVQEETRTIAADTMVPGSSCTITVQPTDGTLGTDDVVLHGVYLKYTKKPFS